MKKKNKINTLLLFFIFLLSCNKKYEFGIAFFSSFNQDNVKLIYNNISVMDTCLTTDASVGIAETLSLAKIENAILTVIVNDTIEKSVRIDERVCGIYIQLKSHELKISKDSICKKRVYY
jgi:hypothetical protein